MEWDHLIEEARLHGDLSAQLAAAQPWETKACRDVEEIHGMFEDLSARVKLDEETKQDLKLKAEDRSAALQQRAN